MAVTINFDNDELATLFFYIQLDENSHNDPIMEKLIIKMESLIFSRFSIDEIERYKNKVMKDKAMGSLHEGS